MTIDLTSPPLQGKKVLLRVDFNVPIENGAVVNDSRIRASLPTIQYLLEQNASIILMSHLGRPKGKVDPKLSLAPCAKKLSEILKMPVPIAPDCVGKEVEEIVSKMGPKQILLLENLRFHIGEEKPDKDPDFTKQLAHLADFYINDAFGAAHRSHASTTLIASYFPKKCALGFLMQKEIDELSFLIKSPPRPFYAIIGGAKISSKIGVIGALLKKVDALFIGGAMAFPFLQNENIPIGDSLIEKSDAIKDLDLTKIHLPLDLVIADKQSNDAKTQCIPFKQGIPDGWQGLDIGQKTVEAWTKVLKNGKTIFWNGPLGAFEIPKFAIGTQSLAKSLASIDAHKVIGGGDSVTAIEQAHLSKDFTYLSTGGGASLEFLEFEHLPGIDALKQN